MLHRDNHTSNQQEAASDYVEEFDEDYDLSERILRQNHAARYLTEVCGSENVHLVAILNRFKIPPKKRNKLGFSGTPEAETFSGEARFAEAVRWAQNQNDIGYDIYFSPQPLKGFLQKKATKRDVRGVTHLLADIDPPRTPISPHGVPQNRPNYCSKRSYRLQPGSSTAGAAFGVFGGCGKSLQSTGIKRLFAGLKTADAESKRL
jgi:hypothetical protein